MRGPSRRVVFRIVGNVALFGVIVAAGLAVYITLIVTNR